MNSNLEKSKKRLTIIFTLIVFSIFLLIGLIFFSGKYFREVQIQENEFVNLTNKYSFNGVDLYRLINRLNTRISLNRGQERPAPDEIRDIIVLDNNNNIIYNNTREDISFALLDNILLSYKNNEIIKNNRFIIKKINLKNNTGTIIFIKKMHYSTFDYLKDIFEFLLLNILFSSVLYYISYKLINKVFIPVEKNIKDMNEFIQNVGHELKTPLSVIDSNIQIINDIKKYDKNMINELKEEILRINSIIDSLIILSNINSNINRSNINLKENVNLILKENKEKIKKKKLNIKVLINKEITIYTNKDYLNIFLSNLIGNAIKYNVFGGKLLILFNNHILEIEDSGIGISKFNKNKIFNRFYKEDESRNSEGFGIGLSLVKKISDINLWNIEVISTKNKGTKFIIKNLN